MLGERGPERYSQMTAMLIGYARVSTNDQDLTAQKNALVVCLQNR